LVQTDAGNTDADKVDAADEDQAIIAQDTEAEADTETDTEAEADTETDTEDVAEEAEPVAEEPASEPVPAVPLEATREAIKFVDVPDDYWAKPYIDALSERKVIDGIGPEKFEPDAPVNRAQLASAISQAFPLEDRESAIAFSDLEIDYWATDAIDKTVKGGYMNGFPDKSFQPTLPVPRVQVLTALITGLNNNFVGDAAQVLDRYQDTDQVPEWALSKMAAATQSNIVVNYPNLDTLNPNQPATRAEVAAMIYQTLVAQGRIEPIAGDYVVQP
ncbi:MAG: S-layer homology domain-containing protein, partial [Moorea sp. SIO3C2]|nr:S-layer homology domain-containing protein [Moorena sp. SIO3C2]